MKFGKTAAKNWLTPVRKGSKLMVWYTVYRNTNTLGENMSDKLFKIAGVSKLKGSYKVRFANDMTRVKVLAKTGHTEIELVDLPRAMTKPELVTHLKTTELYARPEFKQAIDAADEKYNGSATVKVAGVKVKAPAKAASAKPAKEAVTA